MIDKPELTTNRRRRGPREQVVTASLMLLIVILSLLWVFRYHLRSPQTLYEMAQQTSQFRAGQIYDHLGSRVPEIEAYARIWAAEVVMPSIEAVDALREVIAYSPESPVAQQAHIVLARHYAAIEAAAAEDEYRAALTLYDSVGLRMQLARHLEEMGRREEAYEEYRRILGDQPDSFADMRRTGPDPVTVAGDLEAAYYLTDVLETLADSDDPETLSLRAKALVGLGRYAEAEAIYRDLLELMPDDGDVLSGLAEVLAATGQSAEAIEFYRKVETADSGLALADLLEDDDPEEAIRLYTESPDEIGWWYATALLEGQGRLTETFPIYERLAQSGSYLADDAAFRLHILAQRAGDEDSLDVAAGILSRGAVTWLSIRAGVREFAPALAPTLPAASEDVLSRIAALESLGRDDLAYLEFVLTAQSSHSPEVDLAMAQGLEKRGYVVQAQSIAASYIVEHSRAPREIWQLGYPTPYADIVEAAAAEYDLDPLLIWSIMRQESRYDPDAVSYMGARGLMQIMPPTQTWIAEELGREISPGEAFEPGTNIEMSAWLLRFLLDYFDGEVELALAAYNGGAGSVDAWLADPLVSDRDDFLRWIQYRETREYLEYVMLNYEVYQFFHVD